uniref:G domain-containing protein n=1 Tax=Globodera rostochiensis TaxID=31243 RepID=A0A914IE91_GLORO
MMTTSSSNTTDGDLTADKVNLPPSFAQPELAQRQQTNSPFPTESGFDLVSSSAGGRNDEADANGFESAQDAATLQHQQLSQPPQQTAIALQTEEKKRLAVTSSSPKTTHGDPTPDKVNLSPSFDQPIAEVPNDLAKLVERQQTNSPSPTEIGRQFEQKKCLAVVEVEQKKNKSTICLKYAFFVTEAEPFSASGDEHEHCNPTVGHMMRTLLPDRLSMSMVQLTKKFGLQLQYLDNEFEPARFIDIDPRKWDAERVKNCGEYKVLLNQKASVRFNLPQLIDDGILNILLLGETCMGKSTLINAVVNYLKHPTFDEAIKADEIEWVIPVKFDTEEYDDDGNSVQKEFQLGKEREDERLEFGKLHTKRPTAYIIHSKGGQKIRLIDTPGTSGVEEDYKNFQNILNFISTLPELHAICILLQANNNCITPQSKYGFNELFTHLHKNAAENIVFMCTFGRGTFYKMGKTRQLLAEVLDEAKNVSIPLNRDRIYCLDNEALEHLCLIKKANVHYSQQQKDTISESWGRADQEVQRLFSYVSTLKPHCTRETLSLNIARKSIVDLTPALAHISEAIQDNLVHIKQHAETIITDKRDTLSTLESYRMQMLHERETIYSKAALFCSFLKTWALKPINDRMEDYILLSINNSKRFVAKSDGKADQRLEGLKEALRLYKEQKELIEAANANDSTVPKVINAADVTEFLEELCKLPIFGESIKQMYETRQKEREDNQKRVRTGTEFMPKPSSNGMPGNRMEQYPNELEQQRIEQQRRQYDANPRQCKDKSEKRRVKPSRGFEANDAQMASGSAGFRQQPPSANFDEFCRKLPLVGTVYRRIRPSLAQPPQLQQQQQQKFESFSSSDISESRHNNNQAPRNGDQNQSHLG